MTMRKALAIAYTGMLSTKAEKLTAAKRLRNTRSLFHKSAHFTRAAELERIAAAQDEASLSSGSLGWDKPA
jgi:hypothetical protein